MNTSQINELLEEISVDRTVPRNVRSLIEQAQTSLSNDKSDMMVRISSVISILDDVSNDSNIPIYTRTQIWNIVSLLEAMNEQLKQ